VIPMTRDADFKRLVRARMAATGEQYAVARQALVDARPRPALSCSDDVVEAEDAARQVFAKTVRTFFDGVQLRAIPSRRRPRVAVLLHLLERFDAGRDYSEPEVNAILRTAHDDVASLRRELVDYRYLTRGDGRYRVADVDPVRDVNEAQEVPPFEAEVLAQLRARSRPRATPAG